MLAEFQREQAAEELRQVEEKVVEAQRHLGDVERQGQQWEELRDSMDAMGINKTQVIYQQELM